MAFDLDACIAAANRASQACEYGLGSCSRTLHIGFFFDGVGRNIEQDASEDRLSNIARLYRAYPTPEKDSSTKNHQKFYISGLGTPFLEMEGEALQQIMDGTSNAVRDALKDQPTDALKDIFKAKAGGASTQDAVSELRHKAADPEGPAQATGTCHPERGDSGRYRGNSLAAGQRVYRLEHRKRGRHPAEQCQNPF